MLKPMSEEELAKEVQDVLTRVRSRPHAPKPVERGVTTTKVVACAQRATFAARYSRIEADIVVDVPRRGRVLVVEVAWFKEPSIKKAIGHRDSRTPLWTTNFDYFMLVLREDVHVWGQNRPPESPPDFSAPIGKVWVKYLGESADKSETLGASAMEFAIWCWLEDVTRGIRPPDPESEADQMLLSSGLYDLMQNGDVLTHVVA